MKKETEVTIDFLEMDHIREAVKKAAKDLGFISTRETRTPYSHSSFYAGRGVTRLSFYGFSGHIGGKILRRIAKEFPEYFTDYNYQYDTEANAYYNITIYLRRAK